MGSCQGKVDATFCSTRRQHDLDAWRRAAEADIAFVRDLLGLPDPATLEGTRVAATEDPPEPG